MEGDRREVVRSGKPSIGVCESCGWPLSHFCYALRSPPALVIWLTTNITSRY